MGLIFKYLSKSKWLAFSGLIVKVISTVMDLLIPYILSYIIDKVIIKDSIPLVVTWGCIMIVAALCGFLFNVLANRIASETARRSSYALRKDLFYKIESLSESQKDKITLPSLVGRMTTDTYNIHQMTGTMQRLGVRSIVLLFGGIIVCALLDAMLTLVMGIILPLIMLVIIIIARNGMPLFNDLQDANDDLVQNVRENATGARIIKALAKESEEIDRFNDININVSDKNIKANIKMAGLNPFITVLLNVGLVCVIAIGAIRCNAGLCTNGVMISFTSYFVIISNAMLSTTRVFITYSKATASAKRINEVFELEDDLTKENDDSYVNSYIEFDNVTFSYLKQHNNIENISFKLMKNESLGIIGATGSGKTTILNLLMRFYDPDSGNIYVDHKNIKSYDVEKLREMFGVVFQNDLLFNESIYENVNFGRNLSEEEVILALKRAQAYDFVSKLENNINFKLDAKGNNLSGGQKQRLLIARALAGNPQIILLDDSSSALDYKTDALLRKELYKNYSNLIIVAQRISSVKDCSKIMVIDRGQIVGLGTHKELLSNCIVYSQIAYSQMGITKEDEEVELNGKC